MASKIVISVEVLHDIDPTIQDIQKMIARE